MIFSKSSEYAMRATIYLCLDSKGKHCYNIKEISEAIDSPPYFTSKILQSLARQKIISSMKGPNGGFYIDKNNRSIKMYDLILAIEGFDFFEKCLLGLKKCTDKNPCPLHPYFKNNRDDLKKLFQKKSISDILTDQKSGKIHLK